MLTPPLKFKNISSIKELKETSTKGANYCISLNEGVISRKYVKLLRSGKFYIENSNDDTTQTLTAKELKDKNLTNIYYAMKHKAFFLVH